MTVKTRKLPAKNPVRRSAGRSPVDLSEPISYVRHPAFRRKDVERELRRIAPLPEDSPEAPLTEPGLTFVAGFVSQPLLSRADEPALFAWMNFHRFRAEQFRRRALIAGSPGRFRVRMQQELSQAARLRNRIVSSNLRLVVSLAKKLARSLDQMSELISEGMLPLIRAVELFDISLGNRFSTYATWAVRNQMLRSLKRARLVAFVAAPEMVWDDLPGFVPRTDNYETLDSSAGFVQTLLAGLPERERIVVQARFGLAGEPAGQSLADVAAGVGLSKERVRQLVLKSLEAMRQKFADGGL